MQVVSLNLQPVVLLLTNLLGIEQSTAQMAIRVFITNMVSSDPVTTLEFKTCLDLSIREALDLAMEDDEPAYVEMILLRIKPYMEEIAFNLLGNNSLSNYDFSNTDQLLLEMRGIKE